MPQSLFVKEMHLKINTETFAIVQQGVRLVCLPSHSYEIKDLLPDLMGQNSLSPESIALRALTHLIESREFPPISIFQIPSVLTEKFRFYLVNTYRKMYLLFYLF